MKTRPILFNSDMVQALLAGRKTQTRRIVKCGNDNNIPFKIYIEKYGKEIKCRNHVLDERSWDFSPYGKKSDLLYVRETFVCGIPLDGDDMPIIGNDGECVYKTWYAASSPDLTWDNDGEKDHNNPPWKPSIHMPRWASRLTLKITDVKVERLQDISEEDAIAEGIIKWPHEDDYAYGYEGCSPCGHATPTGAYRALWESINGSGSWDLNPWVWAISFEVIEQNIDDYLKRQK